VGASNGKVKAKATPADEKAQLAPSTEPSAEQLKKDAKAKEADAKAAEKARMAKSKAAEKKDGEKKDASATVHGAAEGKKEDAKVLDKNEVGSKTKAKINLPPEDMPALKQKGKQSNAPVKDDKGPVVQAKALPADNKAKDQPAIEKKAKLDAKVQPSNAKTSNTGAPSKPAKNDKKAVKQAKDMTKDEAATKIQSQARGYNDRQKTKSWWPFSSSKTETKDGKESEEDKIKAGAKAAKEAEKKKQLAAKNAEKEAKKSAKDKKKDVKKSKDMTKDEAATKIQSQARGYNDRKKANSWWPFSSSKTEAKDGKTEASDKKTKKEAEKAAKEAEKQKKLAEENAEKESKKVAKDKKKGAGKAKDMTKDEAATKIQSQARGYNAREKKGRWRPWGGSKSPHPILDSESGKKGGASGAVDSAANQEAPPGSGKKKKTPTKATNDATSAKAGSAKKGSSNRKEGEKGAAAASGGEEKRAASGTKARASNEGDLLALAAATELNKEDDDSVTQGMLSSLPSTPQVSTKKMGPPSDEDRQKLLRESERLSTEV